MFVLATKKKILSKSSKVNFSPNWNFSDRDNIDNNTNK